MCCTDKAPDSRCRVNIHGPDTLLTCVVVLSWQPALYASPPGTVVCRNRRGMRLHCDVGCVADWIILIAVLRRHRPRQPGLRRLASVFCSPNWIKGVVKPKLIVEVNSFVNRRCGLGEPLRLCTPVVISSFSN